MSKEFKMSDVKILIDNEVYISAAYISKLSEVSTYGVRKYIPGYHRRFKLEAIKINGFYFVKEENFWKFIEFHKKLTKLRKEQDAEVKSLRKEYEQEVA